MKLLETYIEISAKDDALKAGLKNAGRIGKQAVKDMNKEFGLIRLPKLNFQSFVMGAATLWGMKESIDALVFSSARAGDNFYDMSQRTGVSTENLSALGYAAKLTGTEIESVERGIKILNNSMLDISRGGGAAKQTFKDLGINVTGSNGQLRDSMSVMMEAADKLSKLKNETLQSAYATDIFGKSGTQLLPILKLGSAGFRQLEAEANRLGMVWSSQDANAANELMDATEALIGSITGLKKAIGSNLFPILTDWSKKATDLIVANREIIKNGLLAWVNKITGALKMLWNYRGAITAVFEYTAILYATNAIAGLVSKIIKLTIAMEALGAVKSWQMLITYLGGAAVVSGTTAVMGTTAAVLGLVWAVQKYKKELEGLGLASSAFATTGTGYQYTPPKAQPQTPSTAFAKTMVGNAIYGNAPIDLTAGVVQDDYKKAAEITKEQESILYNTRKEYADAKIALIENSFAKERAQIEQWYSEQQKLLKDNNAAPEAYKNVAGTKALKMQGVDRSEFDEWTSLLEDMNAKDEEMKNKRLESAVKYEAFKEDEANKIVDLQKYTKEQTIRNTLDGYAQEKALAEANYEDDYNEAVKKYGKKSEVIEKMEAAHKEYMLGLSMANTAEMNANILSFANTWANTMTSVVEQSGNSFTNIARMFSNMVKKMAVEAAFTGLISMLFPGGPGFMAGVKSVLKIPGFAEGGDVSANKPVMVGEKGAELFIPNVSGKIIPNSGLSGKQTVINDSSTIVFNISPSERAEAEKMSDKELSDKFERCYREGRMNFLKKATA